jgi:exosome complex RNA-binding protein Rrp42 (RNase PH superfamily)
MCSLLETEFVKNTLCGSRGSLRLDGRDAFSYRDIKIDFLSSLDAIDAGDDPDRQLSLLTFPSFGEVEISFGNTKVFAVTTGEISEPSPEKPKEGEKNLMTFSHS